MLREIPLATTLGIEHIEMTPERSVFRMPIPEWSRHADGRLPAGAVAAIVDMTQGFAASTARPEGGSLVTTRIQIDFPRGLPRRAESITAVGTLRHADSRRGLSHGDVTDEHDNVIASGTLDALYLPAGRRPQGARTDGDRQPSAVEGGATARPAHPLLYGSPVHHALKTRVDDAGPGAVTISVPAERRFANTSGALHGGFGALLGDLAQDLALATVDHHPDLDVTELRVLYLRGLPADGCLVTTRAAVVHHGRSLVVTRAEILTADGRIAVQAEASHTRVGTAGS